MMHIEWKFVQISRFLKDATVKLDWCQWLWLKWMKESHDTSTLQLTFLYLWSVIEFLFQWSAVSWTEPFTKWDSKFLCLLYGKAVSFEAESKELPKCTGKKTLPMHICQRTGSSLIKIMACHFLNKWWSSVYTLRLRQNGLHFPDDSFKCIFLNENLSISLKISLMFVPKVQINNVPAMVQVIFWNNDG